MGGGEERNTDDDTGTIIAFAVVIAQSRSVIRNPCINLLLYLKQIFQNCVRRELLHMSTSMLKDRDVRMERNIDRCSCRDTKMDLKAHPVIEIQMCISKIITFNLSPSQMLSNFAYVHQLLAFSRAFFHYPRQ